jgi:AcrR family transcriptional regulator
MSHHSFVAPMSVGYPDRAQAHVEGSTLSDRSVRYVGHIREVVQVPRRATTGARERILDAAAALFYSRGVRAVGMNDVVAAAGCGKNLLYAHFPSKVELVAAYLERFRVRRERAAGRAIGSCDDPAAQLVALTAEVADRIGTPGFRGCAMRNYLVEFPDADDEASRVARAYLQASRAEVRAVAGRLGAADADGLAERVWLVVEGLYASGTRPAEGADARTAVALVEEIVAGAPRNART